MKRIFSASVQWRWTWSELYCRFCGSFLTTDLWNIGSEHTYMGRYWTFLLYLLLQYVEDWNSCVNIYWAPWLCKSELTSPSHKVRQNVISVIMGYVVAVTTTTYYVVVVVTEVKDRVGRSVVSSAIAIASPGFRIGSSVRSCVRRGHAWLAEDQVTAIYNIHCDY